MRGIRGAICAHDNTKPGIYGATQHLLREMVRRNGLTTDDIVAAFFTMTPDLNADFPAYAARDMGWANVAMLGAQESLIPGAPERAIRVLLFAMGSGPVRPVYLGRAAAMRPDLATAGDADAWDDSAAEAGRSADDRAGRLFIIGLGLIGGSLAGAARGSGLFESVLGYDINAEATSIAASRGLIDGGCESLEVGVVEAELIVLAAPVEGNLKLVSRVGELMARGAVLTDVGSVKGPIVDAMNALPSATRALAGHPMTGHTASGTGSADPALFRGTKWALVRTRRSDDETVARVERLIRGVGALPVHMTAEEHDTAVSVTSHLPAAIAVSLTELVGGDIVAGKKEKLVGPGLVSATRLASGEPLMTAQMLRQNRGHLKVAIDSFIERLRDLSRQLDEPQDLLVRRLSAARTLRSALVPGSAATGARPVSAFDAP